MRILHVVEVDHGGVVSYVSDLGREQIRRGHEVHLLAPKGVFDLSGAHDHEWSMRRKRPTSLLSATLKLRRAVRRIQPDVVHLHSFFPGLLGRMRLTKGSGPPRVYQPHAWAFDATANPRIRRVIAGWERLAARRGDAIVACSSSELEAGLSWRIPVHPEPLGSPVDVDRFHPVGEEIRAKWRAELGVRAPRLLVCVGRLCRQKAQELLLDAWTRSPAPNTELVLVGPGDPGPLLERLPAELRSTVRAVGGWNDVRPWLWACDLVVVAARYEANSLSTGEALACGRPVVTTDVGGAHDAVGAGSSEPAGCVVPQEAVDALLREAKARLDDPELTACEGMNARIRAERIFAPSALVERFDAFYAQVTARAAELRPTGRQTR
ncbi:MAG: glycosyltransferase [Stackebrandtia sp.]